MVKVNKSSKKRRFENEKQKKKSNSLKDSFTEEDNDKIEMMSQGEDDQGATESENDSDPKDSSEELDGEEAVSDADEEEDGDDGVEDENSENDDEEDEDEEITSLKYEESDEEEDVPFLDKTVYEESDEEDEEPKEKIKKSEKSKGRAAKKMKLEKTEAEDENEDNDNDDDEDDDEIREEPIKRESDVKENPLKRKNTAITKKQSKDQKDKTPIISIEEIPKTFFVKGLPATLDKSQMIEFLEQHIKFKRIFFQKVKRPQQPSSNLYVVFENDEQIKKLKQTKVVYKDPVKPNLPEKQITFVESRWTSFSSLKDHCVCVKNLEPTVTKEQLEKSFKTFGNILNIDVIKQIKGETMKSPIAYIFFEKVSSAEQALQMPSVKLGKTDAKVESMRTKETHLEKYIKIGIQGAPLQVRDCSKTLFVGNASIHTTNKDVESFLSKFGKINRVRGYDVETLKHRKFRKFYVVFEDTEGYSNALKAEKLVLAKHNLHVTPLKWESVPEFSDFIVKVGGISLTVEKEKLKEKFEQFGPVECIELKVLKGKSHAYALIFYKKKESAQKALSFDGCLFEGDSLSVSKHKCFEDQNTIFVKKPRNGKVTGEDIEAALKVFGKIKKVNVLFNCFSVSFCDKVNAFKALKNKTVEIAGVPLQLFKYELKKQTKGKSFGVLVTGFPKTTTIEKVKDHFKDCGEIKKSYICNSSDKKGVAFLEFTDAKEKAKAFKFNKTLLNGKSIFVKNAMTRN